MFFVLLCAFCAFYVFLCAFCAFYLRVKFSPKTWGSFKIAVIASFLLLLTVKKSTRKFTLVLFRNKYGGIPPIFRTVFFSAFEREWAVL